MIHPAPYLTALSLPSDAPAAGPRERRAVQAGAGRTSSQLWPLRLLRAVFSALTVLLSRAG